MERLAALWDGIVCVGGGGGGAAGGGRGRPILYTEGNNCPITPYKIVSV